LRLGAFGFNGADLGDFSLSFQIGGKKQGFAQRLRNG
jgi:hypothetical protein